MNLFRVYSMLVILLVLCTYDAEGGIILLLLLKIIALKGALFFGMPLAIGSFMMGQGLGFFGGSMFGGYSMLSAAHKYQKAKENKYKSPYKHKPISHISYGPPSYGWNRGSNGHRPHYVTASPGWESPTTHYHYYNHHEQRFHVPISQPSLLSKITKIPSLVVDHFRKVAPVTPVSPSYGQYGDAAGNGWQQPAASGWNSDGSGTKGGYGQNPMNTYYDTADTGDKYGGILSIPKDNPPNAPGGADWNQGLANLLKAAELAKQEVEIPSDDGSSGHYNSQIQPSVGSGYESSVGSPYDEPSVAYGPATQYYTGDSKSPSNAYGAYSSDVSDGSYSQKQPNLELPPHSNAYSYNVDRESDASEEHSYAVKAPNFVIEQYLEKKLKEQMLTQKTVEQKKEAAQLIKLLRQAYVQELVESLHGGKGGKTRGSRMATTEIPAFKPFPVPNGTTARPKSKVQVSTLQPTVSTTSASPSTAPVPGTGRMRAVRIRSKLALSQSTTPAPSSSAFPFPPQAAASSSFVDTSPVASASSVSETRVRKPFIRHYDESVPSGSATSAGEPTRFVRMKTSFTMANRRMDRRNGAPIVRNRRQQSALELQALTSFTDDVKKFFLLVSLLDQDKCLQKLVCDVHTRSDKSGLTTYESNIVITFKVMNTLLPIDAEDSTTNYRKASKIGELSKSEDVCRKAYPTCTYSTGEIINMGNQVANTGNVEGANPFLIPQPASPSPAPSSDQDQDGSASELKPQVVGQNGEAIGMPRV